MEELSENMKRSLRRWWTKKERAGDLTTKEAHIANMYFSQFTEIAVLLPFPRKEVEDKKTKKEKKMEMKRERRRLEYFKELAIDPTDYNANVHQVVKLQFRGARHDWRNNTLGDG
jgi:hypothetical protein